MMTRGQYQDCAQKINFIIDSLDILKGDIESFGGFQTETVEEDFWDNIEHAVVSLQDCMENLEADEAVCILKKIIMNVFKFILDFIMKLFATKTEEISVDASEIQEQLNNLSKRIDSLKQPQSASTSSSDLSAMGDMLDALHDKIKEIEQQCKNDSSIKNIQEEINNLKHQITTVQSSNNISTPQLLQPLNLNLY